MSAEGIWDLSISTPIGRIAVELDIRRENGTLAGTASGAGERVSLHDIVLDGDRLTWNQAVRKPMRLNLAFAVTVEGDALTGTAEAGRLPASKVTGVRRGGVEHIR
ncbi:hypothetical protein [Nocardia sp. NRRL WC-3656]|uniref:hypothetical protein n=1 Tax=Nocardia sp. NRRL WC-3656 TaxID=1463824 RepID=UPI0004C2BA1B|nr:hypothetical protein [Nocardia sp. NRRL WC-3656]